ncbi:DNA polymerase III subunit delta' [Weissella koreensis]|uniref:DNA polymerase III subunit delta n=1 Tax=Weissella koreensis TaxID=165096 RepID=A0A7H1MM79_9LACO|nr:DNA polymerase III subunit delta' [Weissella koreensis]AVH75360.1 DNA polymerase III subunit delta' [Weissella koreensis]EJF34864.1 DNA polymerase III subunit delta [Weissella koreensis KCTC 3621]MCZ9311211.1 DNA polymerase III subunit delta' [Weissella koreensis]QGN20586.1 DNA polymerase III subunit delta' [Weissella koreensis]QNT64565.1 DNA polymerase III subunit delta' [Weissella koreensis]
MEAQEIVKRAYLQQSALVERLKLAIESHQLAHAFLFTGPKGQGQLDVATWLAMRLMCEHPKADGDPDLTCSHCQRIAAHEHPDVIEVKPDGRSIKIDQIRYLQDEFNKTAVEGQQKIFIISAADTMTDNAANGLLKFIEEPVGQQTAILMVENRQQVLPTIVSRTQVIDFHAIEPVAYQKALVQLGYSKEHVKLVAALTNSLETAGEWLVDDWFENSYQVVADLVESILKLDPKAFNQVQINLMPLAQDKSKQLVLLNLLASAWRDLLLSLDGAISEPRMIEAKQWLSLAQSFGINRVLKVQDIVLEAPKWLKSNIGFQTVVETVILKSQFGLAAN